MPDNREIASAILLLPLLIAVLASRSTRALIPNLISQVLKPTLLLPLAVYGAYASGLVVVAHRVGLWRPSLWWGTGLIVVAGLGLLAKHLKAEHAGGLIRALLRDTFSATVVLTLYVNTAPFSLPVELLVQLVTAFFAITQAYSTGKESARSLLLVSNFALAVVGLVMLWHTTSSLLEGAAADSWPTLWRAAAMAIWYPVGLLPFLYVFAYFVAAEKAGSLVRIFATGRERERKWLWTSRMLVACRGSLRLARSVAKGDWTRLFARAADHRERRQRSAEYRAAIRAAAPPAVAPGGAADGL